MQIKDLKYYATLATDVVLKDLKTSDKGLSHTECTKRQKEFGFNEFQTKDEKGVILEFISRLSNPLVIMLVVIAIISVIFGQHVNAGIIITMAVLSVVLSFVQERHASNNAKKLQEMVKIRVKVKRLGRDEDVLVREIVPGDIVELGVGKMVPADMRIITAKDLHVSQASLNGESFPVRKFSSSHISTNESLYDNCSLAFMGSSVASGIGTGVVIKTGKTTEFGKLSGEVIKVDSETGFDKGIKNFTWLMIRLIAVLTVFIFAVNALLRGNFVEAILFALSVAVGLTPELLPMIVTINLSKGALDMAKKKVIVKKLDSIQNFGAMDVLCADKTGTLTIDNIVLVRHTGVDGRENEEILRLAYINSSFQSGLENLLDRAVIKHKKFPIGSIKKIDEMPYDFERKRMSVVVRDRSKILIVSKGAPEEILKITSSYLHGDKVSKMTSKITDNIKAKYDEFSKSGFRVLAIAYKDVNKKERYSKHDENDMVLAGFVAFLDPSKPSAKKAILDLAGYGVDLKILSGDNELVTRKICSEVGIEIKNIIRGDEVEKMDDLKLQKEVEGTNVFVRISPMQKERVVKALQRNNHIVGFLGDGINDAPSIKASDVGISVNNATDIAKETADIILLEKNLTILSDVVIEGRKTFANVIKYIKMGASSNFGNMLSMAGASIFLPFLPMLPTQILLNNFLYDASQISIPTDEVDKEYLNKPRPWNIKFIKEFIVWIGPISSIFDFATFGVMWYVFRASPELFHTGWFVESLCTQVLVVHVIRTNKIPFIESKPSGALLRTTIGIVLFSWILPYFPPIANLFGFKPLPFLFFVILILMSGLYLYLVQVAKKLFIKRFGFE